MFDLIFIVCVFLCSSVKRSFCFSYRLFGEFFFLSSCFLFASPISQFFCCSQSLFVKFFIMLPPTIGISNLSERAIEYARRKEEKAKA